MFYSLDDTIVAIASAAGGSYRGIVRLSGPATIDCLTRTFRARSADAPRLAKMVRASVVEGSLLLEEPWKEVPCDLHLWPDRRSYTRQPSGELHTIGAPPLLEAVVQHVCRSGARLAGPGEFTLRAFLAGRLDLSQAEAVLGVIDAQTSEQLTTALGQLAGNLGRPLGQLRGDLLDLLAHLEAGLDFVEEDIEFISPAELNRQLTLIAQNLAGLLDQMQRRGQYEGEARIVLRGMPNAGKSSLLNALSSDNAAIVSDVPGTTRDFVARRVRWQEISCLLIDTAGMEDAGSSVGAAELDQIMATAQQQAAVQQAQAHLQLLCVDASRPLSDWDRNEVVGGGVDRIIVWTKCDQAQSLPASVEGVQTSSLTGEGLDRLRESIVRHLLALIGDGPYLASTSLRCRESLRLALESVQRAQEAVSLSLGEELVAAELRTALDELGKVIGAIYTEDVLDRIFSRFCIGK